MTKTKKELRAEAVERLRKNPYGNAADNQNALLGWGHEPHSLGEAKDALIELLTDDDGEACDHVWTVDYNVMYASCPPKYKFTCIKCGETRVSASCPGDFSFDDKGSLVLKRTASSDSDTQRKLQAWLDLIVERDRYKDMLARAEQGIAELQAKLDYLKAHGITISEPFCGGYEVYNEWKHKADELRADVDELQEKIGELTEGVSELLKKQPYTFNPHDVLGSLETIGRYIDELAAERDYWKQEVQICLDAAYRNSGRGYVQNVMAYPDRCGCTTPSTLVSATIDGLRDDLRDYAFKVEEAQSSADDAEEENARLRNDNERLASHHPPVMEARELERAIWQLDRRLSEAGKLAAEVTRLTAHCENQRKQLKAFHDFLDVHSVGWYMKHGEIHATTSSMRELLKERDMLRERVKALESERDEGMA